MRPFGLLLAFAALVAVLVATLGIGGPVHADGEVVHYRLTTQLVETQGIDLLGLDGAEARFDFFITDVGFMHSFNGSLHITQYDAVPDTGTLRLAGTAGGANDGSVPQRQNGFALLRSSVSAPPTDSLSFFADYELAGHPAALRERAGGLFFPSNDFLTGEPFLLRLPFLEFDDVVSNDFELQVLHESKGSLCGFEVDCYDLELLAISAPEGSAAACAAAALAALGALHPRSPRARKRSSAASPASAAVAPATAGSGSSIPETPSKNA